VDSKPNAHTPHAYGASHRRHRIIIRSRGKAILQRLDKYTALARNDFTYPLYTRGGRVPRKVTVCRSQSDSAPLGPPSCAVDVPTPTRFDWIEARTWRLSVDRQHRIEWDGLLLLLLTFAVVVNNGQIKPRPMPARRSPKRDAKGSPRLKGG